MSPYYTVPLVPITPPMINRFLHFIEDRRTSRSVFPLAYIVALIGTIATMRNIHVNEITALTELIGACAWVFPLAVSAALYSKHSKRVGIRSTLLQAIVALIGVIYYIIISYLNVFDDNSPGYLHIGYLVTMIMSRVGMIGIGTWLSSDNLTIRSRLKTIVLHLILAVISSLILWGGLSASIASINYLFDLNLHEDLYLWTGALSVGIVGISIFLTYLNLSTERDRGQYPSLLRFFGLYIFLPLTVVYALILLAYSLKIVTTQTRPKGLISMMIVGYTARGTLMMLSTYPLHTTNNSIHKLHTGFWISVLVFVPLLYGALRQRVGQYGRTEPRYYLALIGIWMIIVGLVAIGYRKKLFITAIWSLLGLAGLSLLPGVGASSISRASQYSRLTDLLEAHQYLGQDGIIPKSIAYDSLSAQDPQQAFIREISSLSLYLGRQHGKDILTNLIPSSTGKNLITNSEVYMIDSAFLNAMGYTGDRYSLAQGVIKEDTSIIINHQDNKISGLDTSKTNYLILLNSEQARYAKKQQFGSYEISFSGDNNALITILSPTKKVTTINLLEHTGQWEQHNTDFSPILVNGGSYLIQNLNARKKTDGSYIIDYYKIIVLVE